MGVPGDFIELINNGAATADVSGYVVRDNDDTHTYTIPAGTDHRGSGYYVVEIDTVTGRVRAGRRDSARLFGGRPTLGRQLHLDVARGDDVRALPGRHRRVRDDSTVDHGRGERLPASRPHPWPGGARRQQTGVNVFGSNLSGLAYQPSAPSARGVLWAVHNDPSTLYRLILDGARWTPDTTDGWATGKHLRYPDGSR